MKPDCALPPTPIFQSSRAIPPTLANRNGRRSQVGWVVTTMEWCLGAALIPSQGSLRKTNIHVFHLLG